MALKFIEGFGSYSDTTTIGKRWDSTTSLGASVLESGRVTALGNCLGFSGVKLKTKTFSNHATFYVGFAFQNVNLAPTANQMTILEFCDDADVQTFLRFNTSTQLFSVVRGSTVLGTGSTQIVTGSWYYIEMKVVANGTTGAVTLKINTVSELALTNQNTITSGDAQINNIVFRSTGNSGGSGRYKLDDIYILDGSGSTNNNFLGDMKVETLTVSGPGEVTNWTPPAGFDNFQSVQNGSNSVYNSASGSGVIDTYSFSDLAKVTTDIAGVQVSMSVRNSDSVSHTIKSVVRIASSNNLDSSAQTVSTTSFQQYYSIWEEDPDTATTWTASGVNGAEFGIDLVS